MTNLEPFPVPIPIRRHLDVLRGPVRQHRWHDRSLVLHRALDRLFAVFRYVGEDKWLVGYVPGTSRILCIVTNQRTFERLDSLVDDSSMWTPRATDRHTLYRI